MTARSAAQACALLLFCGCSSQGGDDAGGMVAAQYAVGGKVEGLSSGPAVLALNSEEVLEVASDGPFQFTKPLKGGDAYSVSLESSPDALRCELRNASGEVAAAAVTDVLLTCEPRGYVVGESYFGTHAYIEYVAGDLPLIFVAPHGGSLKPDGIPVIHTHVGDGGSLKNMLLTAEAVRVSTAGGRPHLIINHLKSDRMIATQDKDEAAGDHPDARQAWDEFHAFIEEAKVEVEQTWKKGHYFEFHTNGWPEEWINIGVGVSAEHLNTGGVALLKRASLSTVRTLVEKEGADFLEVLRGDTSLGGLLSARGYKVVPCPAIPSPGDGGFFYAGFNTWKHGSRDGGVIDATHIETHWKYINNGAAKREAYSADLGAAILSFMDTHYGGLTLRP